MTIALVSLSDAGARIVERLAGRLGSCDVFLHAAVLSKGTVPFSSNENRDSPPVIPAAVKAVPEARRFDRVVELTREIFAVYRGLVFVAPTGVVVRAIAPLVVHKTVDPAVVAVDVGGRWAVSLLSGHEGGGNDLALAVANVLGAEPIISTTTEAAKDLIVGVGCRRGATAEAIVAAVVETLSAAGCELARVRQLASVEIKADEAGLIEAARRLGLPLRLIASDEIRATCYAFETSKLAQEKVDLPAVAEPAARLAGRRTRLLVPKRILHGVTVAVARENWSSLASAPEGPSTGLSEPSGPSPKAG